MKSKIKFPLNFAVTLYKWKLRNNIKSFLKRTQSSKNELSYLLHLETHSESEPNSLESSDRKNKFKNWVQLPFPFCLNSKKNK